MILYICSPEVDYGQDILYAGLVKKLGRAQILDYPFNHQFYISRKVYPRNMGAMGLSGILSHVWDRVRIPWNQVEAVVLGSCKKFVFERYLEIVDQIPSRIPVVFNDGGDFAEIGGHLRADQAFHLYESAISKRPFDLILKREVLVGTEVGENIIPFPFGFHFDRVPLNLRAGSGARFEKKYQVSFWAVESHPIRTQALSLIENLWDCRSNGTERSQKFHKYARKGNFYLEELKRCSVVLNFRGVGWDTLRYWEVPAIGGFMISEKPGIVIPHNFEHGKHVLFCQNDLSDLVELCDWALKNPEKIEAMAIASQKHALQYHSSIARAEVLLSALSGLRLNR